jgi:hypothetical protein
LCRPLLRSRRRRRWWKEEEEEEEEEAEAEAEAEGPFARLAAALAGITLSRLLTYAHGISLTYADVC